ncbi:MAG: hypothetical protein JWN60_793 [Acidobacteria bacterium]|jgi:hypothetical protein|nr:hypothetical protein [Acidobacteriota bacterium]
MKIINLLINENLLKAEFALDQATADNIIELSRNYLLLLNTYRDELYQLRNMPEINFSQQSTLGRELIEQSRKAVRAALEFTVCERNKTQTLLNSFTSISGYQATETFNQLKYKGFDNWETQSSGVRLKGMINDEFMTIPQAVETAGKLRRDSYIELKSNFNQR